MTDVALPRVTRRRSLAPRRVHAPTYDPETTTRLGEDLRAVVDAEVRFDDGSRALYATDASNYRHTPIGVVIPRTIDAVVTTIERCRSHDVPVLSRGAATSLAGQTCNTAVVIDFSKYLNGINWVDPGRRLASVQPGCVLDDLRQRVEQDHGLTFGPDPSTHQWCTVGGMVGNNACGVHAQMAGRTADNIAELEICTYDGLRLRVGATPEDELDAIIAAGDRRGELYRELRDLRDEAAETIRTGMPDIPRRVSGYTLEYLLAEHGFHVARALVGSEGTCVTVLEIVCELIPHLPERKMVLLGYPDIFDAADAVEQVMEHEPIALEAFDRTLLGNVVRNEIEPEDAPTLPHAGGWLMVEFGSDDADDVEAAAQRFTEDMQRVADGRGGEWPKIDTHEDQALVDALWQIRESGLGATAIVPGEPLTWEGWEDAAVPPERLGDYLREFDRLMERHGFASALYGHFGQGCVHCRINFDLVTAEGLATWRRFLEEAADLVASYGGSLSGEHGDGQSRAELLGRMYGDDMLDAFARFKAIWDPRNRMNPGKVVDPYPLDGDLRLGTDFDPPVLDTHFSFAHDKHDFTLATLRCVGVGKCRRTEGGTMCPSYLVTREEQHTTRGRARMLFEMLTGEIADRGWRSDEVHDSLDLCLACKGCKGDCPVNVDIATYKAEFLSHHYRRRLRPRVAYAMGLIDVWARLASRAPRLVNAIAGHRPLAPLLQRAAGVTTRRPIPRFARQTFLDWFGSRADADREDDDRPAVIIWPDTFTNHLEPDIGRAAVEVVEAAGWRAISPDRPRCCGRPLYDYGMLATAKRRLRRILDDLHPHLVSGTPIIVLEPSCLSVFHDELIDLFPRDRDAERLRSQTFTIEHFLHRHAPDLDLPSVTGPLLAQPHCHQRAIDGLHATEATLERVAPERHEILDAGCCGLAGSFGFEAAKYDLSMAIGDQRLFPALRAAPTGAQTVADGFSCRSQIEHGTGRQARHTAQVLADALRDQRPASG
jgi:FAD/FMN-containing dehydrogenase/Fe-S oxidoreductase